MFKWNGIGSRTAWLIRDFTSFIGILIAIAGTALPAEAQTPITSCPFRVSEPGNYILNADLTCVGDGIDITAGHVSLNLNGHKITGGTTSNSTIGIYAEGYSPRIQQVHIKGPGLIQNFSRGILLNNVDYSRVELVTAAHNLIGLDASPGAVNYLTVASNMFVANMNTGMAGGGNNGVFRDNDLSGNLDYGVHLLNGTNNTLNNNTVNGTANGWGIVLEANSSNSRVDSNVTNGNLKVGIQVGNGSPGNQIINNTSVGNGGNDLEDDNFTGYGTTCGTDLWRNNVFFTSSQPCIH